MDVMSKFNLPNYLKNKTFSQASKIIDDKFKDRTDPESQQTLNELQGRLRDAQEYVKSEQMKLSKPTQPIGEAGNKMFLGGLLEKLGGGEGEDAQMKGLGNALGMASGAAQLANLAFGKPDVDTSGKTDVGEGTSLGGSVLGGAATGVQAGSALGPLGMIGGGLLGGIAGFVGGNKAKDAEAKARFNNTLYKNKELSNRYKKGGGLNLLDPEDPFNFEQENYNAMSNSGGGIRDLDIVDLAPIDQMKDEIIETVEDPEETEAINLEDDRLKEEAKNYLYNDLVSGKINTDSGVDQNKFNPAELLRYAPSAMNLAQLMSMKKPEEVGLDKINTKYEKQLVDEKELQNIVRNATSSNRDAILSSSGGSASAARANLLASQLQGTKALSDAYQKMDAQNRQEGRQEQQFNLDVDKFNIGQSNREEQINAQNLGAYETNKSRLMAALGNDLGGIGREELFKRFPELMGLGYDYRGRKTSKMS